MAGDKPLSRFKFEGGLEAFRRSPRDVFLKFDLSIYNHPKDLDVVLRSNLLSLNIKRF